MRKTDLVDAALCQAVAEMQRGLVDADLGGYVVKKRVALGGRGKRSGARTLVATKLGDRWFFVYGFEKNERANINTAELRMLQEMAKTLLELKAPEIAAAVSKGEIVEICHDDENA